MGSFSDLVGAVHEAAAYPNGFSLQELRSLRTFKGRLAYIKGKLERVGRGSSRVVFRTSDPKVVLKVALNKKGISQNGLEISLAKMFGSPTGVITQVFDFSDDDLWLEAESAGKIGQGQFERLAGCHPQELADAVRYSLNGPNGFSAEEVEGIEELLGIPNIAGLVESVAEVVGTGDLHIGDLIPYHNWGRVGNRLVITDFGLSYDTFADLYLKR